MGKIDHPHHAEHHGESGADQHQTRNGIEDFESNDGSEVHRPGSDLDFVLGGVVRVGLEVADRLGVLRRHLGQARSEEHTSELQSLMRISYAVFCLKKKNITYE